MEGWWVTWVPLRRPIPGGSHPHPNSSLGAAVDDRVGAACRPPSRTRERVEVQRRVYQQTKRGGPGPRDQLRSPQKGRGCGDKWTFLRTLAEGHPTCCPTPGSSACPRAGPAAWGPQSSTCRSRDARAEGAFLWAPRGRWPLPLQPRSPAPPRSFRERGPGGGLSRPSGRTKGARGPGGMLRSPPALPLPASLRALPRAQVARLRRRGRV